MTPPVRVVRLESLEDPQHVQQLSAVLIDCVEGGASVHFMHPLSQARADEFWREVGASAARDERTLLVAYDDDGSIVGTVQVVPAAPENQPHRAEICKMLVHRRARRRGIGTALMTAAEQAAREAGKTLLVLDTVTGRGGDRLYRRLGWQPCGTIPDYALMPYGGLCDTTVLFKRLGP